MLDKKGFDLWADGYDAAVGISDEEDTYPFAAYKKILGTIFQIIMEKDGAAVLDMGFGTGTLAAKLYENGCKVFGQDFSPRMIELASAKMPGAKLYQGDFSQGLAEPLLQQNYDFIVATYSLHHLTDEQKIVLLQELQEHLKKDGKILIGDVMFATREEMERVSREVRCEWDDEECYCVVDELRGVFPDLSYEPFSFCSGLIVLSKNAMCGGLVEE